MKQIRQIASQSPGFVGSLYEGLGAVSNGTRNRFADRPLAQ